MRTSRVSRDTSRVLAASRTQRTLRQSRSTNASIRAAHIKPQEDSDSIENDENDASDSQLSSVPSVSSSNGGTGKATRKRKRGQEPAPAIVKREVEEVSISAITSPKKSSKPKKARRAPAKKVTGSDGSIKMEPPANWEEMYALTREMRNANIAPVDTMGCESLAEKERSPRDQRFQTLIALMLSSQTKDTVTAVAMRGMQQNMPGV